MKKKEIIILINKKEKNMIITILIKKIKGFLKIKCKFHLKIKTIKKIFVKIKKNLLKISIFEIKNNIKLFLILKK